MVLPNYSANIMFMMLNDDAVMDKIIDFDYKKFIDKKTSHPSQYGCEIISEKIYDRIDR